MAKGLAHPPATSWRVTPVLAVLLSGTLAPVTLHGDDAVPKDAKEAVWVWEIETVKGGCNVVKFYEDGTTSEGKTWSINVKRFTFDGESGGTLSDDNLHASGRRPGGSPFQARLLQAKIDVDSQPLAEDWPRIEERGFAENAIGLWELVAKGSNGEYVALSVELTDDGQITWEGRRIAAWSPKPRGVELEFVDPQLGTATLGARGTAMLSGSGRGEERSRWKLALTRIQVSSTWNTDQMGRIVLYTNGRVNAPTRENCLTYWYNTEGKSFQLRHCGCKLGDNGTTFTGRCVGGSRIKGVRVADEQ